MQVPCSGLKECPVFMENKLCQISNCTTRSRYVCSSCFEIEGCHFFQRKGRGAKSFTCNEYHKNDTSKSLDLISKWVQDIATNSDQLTKDILLKELSKTIVNFFERKAEVSKECKLDES